MSGWYNFKHSRLHIPFMLGIIGSGISAVGSAVRYAYHNTEVPSIEYIDSVKSFTLAHPQLYQETDKALSDGSLTMGEYNSIVARGQKLDKIWAMNQVREEIKPKEQ